MFLFSFPKFLDFFNSYIKHVHVLVYILKIYFCFFCYGIYGSVYMYCTFLRYTFVFLLCYLWFCIHVHSYSKPSNFSNILTVRTPKIILNWRSQILAINSNSHIKKKKRIFYSSNTADFPEKSVRVLPKSCCLRTLSRCEFWRILFFDRYKSRYSLIDILFSASFFQKAIVSIISEWKLKFNADFNTYFISSNSDIILSVEFLLVRTVKIIIIFFCSNNWKVYRTLYSDCGTTIEYVRHSKGFL